MNLAVRLLVLIALATSPMAAVAQAEVEVGVGLICDTQQQVERFVREFTTPEATVQAINTDNANACGVANVVYVRMERVSQARNQHGTFDVVSILVLGFVRPIGVMQIPPYPQFTLFLNKEEQA